MGDFNLDQYHQSHKDALSTVLTKYKLQQFVNTPTHNDGGILDLIISNIPLQIGTIPLPFTDHTLTWAYLTY